MNDEEQLLLQQSQYNRQQYEQLAANINKQKSTATKYLGYDSSKRLALLQDAEGNIFYGKPSTNGAIGIGEDIRLRRGYGMPTYDAMPFIKKPPTIPPNKSKKAPILYELKIERGVTLFRHISFILFFEIEEKPEPEIGKTILVEYKAGFLNNAGFAIYHPLEENLVSAGTRLTFSFLNIRNFKSMELKIKFNTRFDLNDLSIAYFTIENAGIVEEVIQPSPLIAALSRGANTIIYQETGVQAYGEKELSISLTSEDLPLTGAIPSLPDHRELILTLSNGLSAQYSNYGGVAIGGSAYIYQKLEVEITNINGHKQAIKLKHE